MRPLNNWLPPAIGLLAAASIAILTTAPPAQPYTWPLLLAAAVFVTLLAPITCAFAMFLTYVALPKTGIALIIRRTSATAACFPPLIVFLQQRSIWAPFVAAFLVWTILPAHVAPKVQWKKFVGALAASVLLQIGIVADLGEESLLSALAVGLAAAPFLWRIRQERTLRGPFKPAVTIAIAALLAILGLTHYLPFSSGSASEGSYAKSPGSGKKVNGASPGFSVGGKYRGVILLPEEEQHTLLVPPLPMMGRDPFVHHKNPIGIPFYGVYWFFQYPDKGPNEDAYRVKGTPDKVTFRSADNTPLTMEAHQNLGRLIDVSACSGIDIAIRNAETDIRKDDIFSGSLSMELILVNTQEEGHFYQRLGRIPVSEQKFQTLSFKIPPASAIQQFDELTIRFPRTSSRVTRSAKIAIERFFLVPRKN